MNFTRRSGSILLGVALLLPLGCSTLAPDAAQLIPRYGRPQPPGPATQPATAPSLLLAGTRTTEVGWQYVHDGRLDDAMIDFNAAWNIDPHDPGPLAGMATVQLLRARRMNGGQPDRASLQTMDEACALFADAMAQAPPTAALRTDAAAALAARGAAKQVYGRRGAPADFDAAETLLRAAEQQTPSPRLYQTWATLERDRGRPDAAADDDRRAAATSQPATATGPETP